jgi:hypothetical protein
MRVIRQFVFVCLCAILAAPFAFAQVQTGSVTGIVTDTSNAILPGVTVTLSGEKLIGGAQVQATDSSGSYRFDRLPPGTYTVRFELQGFKTVERADIVVNASFVANVSPKLEVGNVTETITVQGESPTIDTKSNVQQTVMGQQILEGVPSGRDPWSVAKIIPGVQVSTYDVGGTQSIQQSSLQSHGSNTNDVSYNIDGATVNWPGGGGGATMLYYDQGMFEEVNYMTSAIPAEVMVGGVSINMVTKDAGNKWRGDARYNFSAGCVSPTDTKPGCLESDNLEPGQKDGKLPSTLLGNPTKTTYDFNVAGGGPLVKDRVWVNGAYRYWIVDKLVNAKNPDGTQALDDNTLKNYSGKAVFSASANQKLSASYNWNNKIRGHRRDTPPDLVPDIASLVQTNPASSTQAKYTGIRKKLVYESSFSVMDGQTNYNYQPDTPATAVRAQDSTRNSAANAAQRHEEQPNQRLQFDNTVSYSADAIGAHLFKGGVQFARLKYQSRYDVLNNMWLLYVDGKASQVREYNTPTISLNRENVLGFFVQDSWSLARNLTLNLGMRFDHNVGTLPANSVAQRQFVGAQSLQESTPIKQNIAVWRTGLSYDPFGDGNTAFKTSYSRYGLQVGIDRVSNVNPFAGDFQTCTWTDPNGDGVAQLSEVSACSGFSQSTTHYAGPNGPDWPYSDEVTAGVERQVMKDMRVGAMFYYRTNRKQLGLRNAAIPSSAYTATTINVPNGPGGTLASPKPLQATVWVVDPKLFGRQDNVVDNESFLDTDYKGVEFTANKRLSNRWQMVAGLTIGRNRGGVNFSGAQGQNLGFSNPPADLNNPNVTALGRGIVGYDSKYAFRLSGSYEAPWAFLIAGGLAANQGYPYVSQFTVTRTLLPALSANQNIFLAERGTERLPSVTQIDLRISRAFRFPNGRRISPQLDIYNLTNAYTVQSITNGVGTTYLNATSILAPRIMRVGVAVNF